MHKIADVLEIFSSIQGEGPYVGERQIFIRFADCNLDCVYCDVDKNKRTLQFTINDVISEIKKLDKGIKHKTISLTGGEPLLYADFLKVFLPKLKKLGFKIYLETNATLPEELRKILRYVDIISADVKLPSVSKQRPCWRRHADFLKLGRQKDIFVKAVVSDQLKFDDFKKAVALVKNIDDNMQFVIQPVTNGKKPNVGAQGLFNLQGYASKFLKTVLIIPQMHKILGVR